MTIPTYAPKRQRCSTYYLRPQSNSERAVSRVQQLQTAPGQLSRHLSIAKCNLHAAPGSPSGVPKLSRFCRGNPILLCEYRCVGCGCIVCWHNLSSKRLTGVTSTRLHKTKRSCWLDRRSEWWRFSRSSWVVTVICSMRGTNNTVCNVEWEDELRFANHLSKPRRDNISSTPRSPLLAHHTLVPSN
jgi:hypothetical protein